MKSIIKAVITAVDQTYFKFVNRHFIPWFSDTSNNNLIERDILRDGNRLYKFKRYGNGRFDWQEHLNYLLNDMVLECLINKHGYLILYIHLGDNLFKRGNRILSRSTIDKFRQMADLYHKGKLWIETTSKLLTYNLVYHLLKWKFSQTDSFYTININDSIENGTKEKLAIDDLAGISFVLPNDKDVKILFKNKTIKFKSAIDRIQNKQIAMIPLRSIEWPF